MSGTGSAACRATTAGDVRTLRVLPATMTWFGTDERATIDVLDRVVTRSFAAGLTIAGVLHRDRLDAVAIERLRDVIDELDDTVRDIRKAVFAVLMQHKSPGGGARQLCRVEDGRVFAYAKGTGDGVMGRVDDVPWALEHDGLLHSAGSGAPLARRVGRMFHEIDTHTPIYFELAR